MTWISLSHATVKRINFESRRDLPGCERVHPFQGCQRVGSGIDLHEHITKRRWLPARLGCVAVTYIGYPHVKVIQGYTGKLKAQDGNARGIVHENSPLHPGSNTSFVIVDPRRGADGDVPHRQRRQYVSLDSGFEAADERGVYL